MLETILKRFEEPDEVRTFEKGKFELVRIGGMTIGRATLRTGLEVVPARWAGRRRCALQRRARRTGPLRLCHRSHGGRHHSRTSRRHAFLHSAGPSGA